MGSKDSTTEEKVLEAAKEVFMKYGLYGARMQDIADTAGINKALLHYYFRSKEKLFDAVFDGALEKYFAQMTVIGDKSMPIKERLMQYVDNMFEFFSEYPQMSMFIIKEISINPEMFYEKVKSLKTQKSLLVPTLQEAFINEKIEPFDPVLFMVNLHSLCAYPFLASPLYKVMLKKHGYDWDGEAKDKIKQSVKDFISFKFQ
ncbi:MAG: transcriptional regulator, TetR family [Fluviicola sp.]|jgi:AcrR family transcriptional regulator|uniref:TetR/AcrR family transcriptional regulator n=1 Tax=Fluviicola sp. TaxID=1917219 RepID=UPI00262E76E9|nr:TetR/AcrR family transcriptional regulator [Fluviicola sp.]MDF3028005.1 transcriptional regulator, TetR family [Fluviicola sp.]